MNSTILIIEDEKNIVDIIKFNLTREGYKVLEAYDGLAGLDMVKQHNPDLVLLDVMLPKLDGFEVCQQIRKEFTTPVIMLTAREGESDKIFGLDQGADDYMTKPFSIKELVARVRANIRRRALDTEPKEQAEAGIEYKNLLIDTRRMEARKNGKLLELSMKEFDLLSFFAANPSTVFTREILMEKVWNYEFYGDVRTVDVTVSRLREKIEDNPAKPEFIITRRGAGYLFGKAEAIDN